MRPAKVVVLGAGNVGWNAAWIAAGMEAEVVLIDKNLDRLRWVDQIHRGRIMTLASNRGAIERSVADADLLIGAVLVAGGPGAGRRRRGRWSPAMKPEAVIVDVAVDQGGCIETIRETTHDDPMYEEHGVIHYAVGNMPGAVPHTSTYALTNATLPYLQEVAVHGPAAAARRDPAMAFGVNTVAGAGHQPTRRRVPRRRLRRATHRLRRRPPLTPPPRSVCRIGVSAADTPLTKHSDGRRASRGGRDTAPSARRPEHREIRHVRLAHRLDLPLHEMQAAISAGIAP